MLLERWVEEARLSGSVTIQGIPLYTATTNIQLYQKVKSRDDTCLPHFPKIHKSEKYSTDQTHVVLYTQTILPQMSDMSHHTTTRLESHLV